jgi:hypothetical protein
MRTYRPPAESAALRDDHALRAVVRYDHLGGNRERLVFDADDAALRQTSHAGEEQLGVPADKSRSSRHRRLESLRGPVVHRQHVVLRCLDQPEPLQLREHLGSLGYEVASLAVVGAVIEFPDVVVERRQLPADHDPTVVTGAVRSAAGHSGPDRPMNLSVRVPD